MRGSRKRSKIEDFLPNFSIVILAGDQGEALGSQPVTP